MKRLNHDNKRRAFTLVEVAIASGLFLFLLGIVVGYQVYIRQGVRSQRKGLFMSTATLLFTRMQRDIRSALKVDCTPDRVDIVVRGANGLDSISYSYREENGIVERESGMGQAKTRFDFSGWADYGRGQVLKLVFEVSEETPSASTDAKSGLLVKFTLHQGELVIERLEKLLALEHVRQRKKLQWQ